ncbi:MAG: hypothetical protein M1819_006680 [Sarea resinae]|nr:MAG: hypothetical protein M1819_006680 [Sarea resinae]
MAPSPSLTDTTTLLSLATTLLLLLAAYTLSHSLLPRTSTTKTRFLYIWHVFDALIHIFLEGSFLYHSLFSSIPTTTSSISSTNFLGDPHRLYGARYSTAPSARLWQVYAQADRRWEVADANVVAIELLTVGIGAPLAAWCARGLRKGEQATWFWMVVLATGELYGGFMTFVPEWLVGSPNLDTSNFMYKWVYLFFFNTLWVWIPLWILYEAHANITRAFPSTRYTGRTSDESSSGTSTKAKKQK